MKKFEGRRADYYSPVHPFIPTDLSWCLRGNINILSVLRVMFCFFQFLSWYFKTFYALELKSLKAYLYFTIISSNDAI